MSCTNISSFLRHKDDLLHYISIYNPLVLCLTETCVNEEITEIELNIEGYKVFRCNSCSRHTGGVLIFVKKNIKVANIRSHSLDTNFWILSVNIKINKVNYGIAVLYRSPNGNISMFFDGFSDWLDEFIDSNGSNVMILTGDFNIHYDKDTYDKNKLKALIENNGMKQLIKEPTRIYKDSSSTIDLVISNDFNLNTFTEKDYIISDHHIVQIKTYEKINSTELKYIRKKINYDELTNIIIEKSWGYSYSDVNLVAEIFINNIVSSIDVVAPVQIMNAKKKSKKWFDDRCRIIVNERNNKYKKCILSGKEEDWNDFKITRNRAVKVINDSKKDFFRNRIDVNKGNPALMWRYLKEIISPKKTIAQFDSINCEGIMYNDETSISNILNQYFINSIQTVIESIDSYNADMHEILSNMPNQTSVMSKFTSLTLQNLYDIIKTQRKKYSFDEVGLEVVRNLFHVIGYPLLNLINLSLSTGRVPQSFKISLIVPIPKVINTNLAEQLRPVNMLPFCEKVLELAVYNQITSFINDNNIICSYQSGFREFHSCESALQLIISEFKKVLDEKGVGICAVFIDLKRAFETVNREILLKKLSKYGFSGIVLQWISCYLDERYQITKFNNIKSEVKANVFGVPQGSVLGPLLFLLYVNDLGNVLNKCKIHLFADDTLIYYYGKNFEAMVNTVNRDLNQLFYRFEINKLKVNESKSKYMFIGNNYLYEKFSSLNLCIRINGQNIEMVQEIKYLGFYIDRQLKFNKHIEYISKKIGKKIGFLRRISPSLSSYSRLTVYNTIILPHFQYCSSLIYTCCSNYSRLQILQNKAMRIILSCNRETKIDVMLNSLNWFNVNQFMYIQTMTFIFKITNNLLPNYLREKLLPTRNVHDRQTRIANSINFYVKATTKVSSMNSLFFKGIVEFNLLPQELKECRTVALFKNRLKYHLKNH